MGRIYIEEKSITSNFPASGKKAVIKLVFGFYALSLIFSPGVFALELIVSDNAADSENSIDFTSRTDTQVSQVNDGEISNNVIASANTGGNTTSGNLGETTIKTGEASQSIAIKNEANFSLGEVKCCNESPKIDDLKEKDKKTPVTPKEDLKTPDPAEEKKEEVKKVEEVKGIITPVAAAVEVAPKVIGLSDTGSEQADTLFFWAGLLLLTFGVKYTSLGLSGARVATNGR